MNVYLLLLNCFPNPFSCSSILTTIDSFANILRAIHYISRFKASNLLISAHFFFKSHSFCFHRLFLQKLLFVPSHAFSHANTSLPHIGFRRAVFVSLSATLVLSLHLFLICSSKLVYIGTRRSLAPSKKSIGVLTWPIKCIVRNPPRELPSIFILDGTARPISMT